MSGEPRLEAEGVPGQVHRLQDLVAAQAARQAEAVALVAPGRKPISYARLLAQIDDLFGHLRSFGVGLGDRVAVVLPNGPEMAATFLGVATAATFAPLNPQYQREEFRFYLSDLRAKTLILPAGIDSPAREVAEKLDIQVLEVEHDPGCEAGVFRLSGRSRGGGGSEAAAGAVDVALVLHTSGTTSRPKIVVLTHANLSVSAAVISETLRLTAEDRCLNVMPLFHVHGLIAGVLASLAAGSSVVCCPGLVVSEFFRSMDEFKPTWYTAVPTMHQAILARARDNKEVVARCRLRFIRSSSAPLPPTVMGELEEAFQAPVLEAYGMTEGSHQIASNPLPPRRRKPGSVGLPTGCRVAVMGRERNSLPPGETGEIVIRGDNVTSGYEKNPEANQAAFAEGWFHTGDEGYVDEEGYIFLTGRLKEIINRGGEKISPREVDEVLLAHPDVYEAVTFAVPHPQLGEEVAAAVVVRSGSRADEEGLRRFAADRLAYFKVPRRVVLLDRIPKGPTGKLQRIGMAESLGLGPEDLVPARSAETTAMPGTGLEKLLGEVWAEVLGLEEARVDHNFFLAGGDSMLAARLVARIESLLEVRLPLAFVFIAPTARKLAELIAGGKLPAEWSALVPIKPSGSLPPFFCVHPHDGQVVFYYDLARLLGPDQPVYGFQTVGKDGKRERHGSLEELAGGYVEELVGVLPEGPYYLGGYCSGAILAFEMARQLEAAGRGVAFLALLDAYAPGYPKPLPGSGVLVQLFSEMADYLQRMLPFIQYLSWLEPSRRPSYLLNLVPSLAGELVRAAFEVRDGPAAGVFRPQRGSMQDLLARYRPRAYGGRAVLFRPVREPLGCQRDRGMGWEGLVTGGLEIVEVPGYHRTLVFRPWNYVLAARLRKCLCEAQEAGGWA